MLREITLVGQRLKCGLMMVLGEASVSEFRKGMGRRLLEVRLLVKFPKLASTEVHRYKVEYDFSRRRDRMPGQPE